MLASPKIHQDSNWYMDLGAKNNLTFNNANISKVTLYASNDVVLLGNDHPTFISHIVQGKNSSENLIFKLSNLLHVP